MGKPVLFSVLLIVVLSQQVGAQSTAGSAWPYIHLGKDTGKVTTFAAILAHPQLSDLSASVVVTRFTISFESGGNIYGPYYTKGAALTDEEIGIIEQLRGAPARIVVDGIKAKEPDGIIRSIGNIILRVDH